MEEQVTGSLSAGKWKVVLLIPGHLLLLHASGDVDATATQAKAEDAGEAEGIIDGWSGNWRGQENGQKSTNVD